MNVVAGDSEASNSSRAHRLLFEALTDEQRILLADADDAKSMQAMLRIYERHGLGGGSRTTLSRRFKDLGDDLLAELNGRNLGDLNLAAIMMDGVGVGSRTVIWALGLTVDGRRIPLGLVEDDQPSLAERKDRVLELLRSLHRRGLDWSDVLWVIDGSKGLRSAILEATSDLAAIQRCTLHKIRNVLKRMPPADRDAIAYRGPDGKTQTFGQRVRTALNEAFAEPDRRKATIALERVSDLLTSKAESATPERRRRLLACAKMVVADVDETLMLQDLGVVVSGRMERRAARQRGVRGVPRSLDDEVATTNLIEGPHDRIADWTKSSVSHWRNAPGMRARWFAFGLAGAEPNWEPIDVDPRQGSELQLAVLKRRNREVQLDTRGSDGILTIASVSVDAGADGAVRDVVTQVLRWADRNGQEVRIEPAALDLIAVSDKQPLSTWAAENGFRADSANERSALTRSPRLGTENAELGRSSDGSRQPLPAAGPGVRRVRPLRPRGGHEPQRCPRPVMTSRALLERLRGVVSEELLLGIGEASLELAPGMVAMPPDELERMLGRLEVVCAEIGATEREARAWLREKAEPAAMTLAREHVGKDDMAGWRDIVGHGRWRVLGGARAQWLVGKAAYREGELAIRAHPDARSHAFADLDWLVARLNRAAEVLAAARELDRRRFVDSVHERVRQASLGSVRVTERQPDLAVNPMERYYRAAGGWAVALLGAYGDAVAPSLAGMDAATLTALRAELHEVWRRRFDVASGMKTVRNEQRLEVLLAECAPRLREEGLWRAVMANEAMSHSDRQTAADRAEVCRRRTAAQWAEVLELHEELAADRNKPRSRDSFLLEHAWEAALDDAVWMALSRQLDRTVDQELPASDLALRQTVSAPQRQAELSLEM